MWQVRNCKRRVKKNWTHQHIYTYIYIIYMYIIHESFRTDNHDELPGVPTHVQPGGFCNC